MVGVDIPYPGRQADIEPGHEVGQAGRDLVLARGQPGVGQLQPDDLGLLRAEHTQRLGGLRGAAPGQGGWIGAARVRSFSVGDGDQPQPGTRGGQHRDGATDAEYLVVG